MLTSAGAENHAGHTGRQQVFNILVGADAAANFHRHLGRRANRLQLFQMYGRSFKRTIEVNHMQKFAALFLPMLSHLGRRIGILGHFVSQTLLQAHALAAL